MMIMVKLVAAFVLTSTVSSKSQYRLKSTKTLEDNKNAEPSIINKAFFQCDRSSPCTHVVLLQNDNYVSVNGEEELAANSEFKEIWEKIKIQGVLWNIALRKPAVLSSIYKNGSSEAELAVNGETEKYRCAETSRQLRAWLMIDLEREAMVISFNVTSFDPGKRIMKKFDLRVGDSAENGGLGNPACATNTQIANTKKSLGVTCPNEMIGRYVTINTVENDFLEVCELEVYGYFID